MMITPTRPTPVAIQRRNPTLSRRKRIDSAVTNSGATKPVADASAIGRNRRPEMKNSEDPTSATSRMACNPGRAECKANSREPGNIAGDMISANTRNLIQAISIEGSVAERYFAVTSDTPRNTVDARIRTIPRNGRSARAGAVRLVGVFSGNAVLSSLGAVADRGGKVELGESDSGQHLKTPIDPARQAPKTGSGYARLRPHEWRLEHGQAAGSGSQRKCLFDRRDVIWVEYEVTGGRVVGHVR